MMLKTSMLPRECMVAWNERGETILRDRTRTPHRVVATLRDATGAEVRGEGATMETAIARARGCTLKREGGAP